MQYTNLNRNFLVLTVLLLFVGFVIFLSASLGLLAQLDTSFSFIILKQILGGGGIGITALLLARTLDYKIFEKYSLYIFFGAILLNLLVFIPDLGFQHGGATRWIELGPVTLQPSDFLRLGAVIFFAAWLAGVKNRVKTFEYGFLPLCVLIVVTEGLLLLQRDTDVVIILTLLAMFFIAGGKIKHFALIGLILILGLVFLLYTRPYVLDRFTSFINPTADLQGSGYQLNQSLIAIGSGGLFGRGLGQSIQKFEYLPEPLGDSIFAVQAEELGFVGSTSIVLLFVFWTLAGLKIAAQAKDMFGVLLVSGIVLTITLQAFINMGSMLGLMPITGVPLPFISQGGTSLILTLFACGIILSVLKKPV